ncbi:MAG: hypothetical protein ABI647_09920 [Gemmatimonadota bacterium]
MTIRASAARAQAAGLPLRMMPSPTGISIGADIGFAKRLPPGATESQGTTTFGASLALGLGPLTASAGISRLTTFDAAGKSSHDASVGAQAGVKVFGGPLVPLSVAIEGGLARVTKRIDPASPPPAGTDERRWRSHLGLGASLTIPNPVLAVKPWLAPRLQYDGGGGISLKRLRGAISAGVDLGLLNGITIRAMYDSRMLTEDPGDAPRVVSIGLGYSFR